MSYLSDIIGNAASQITNNARGVQRDVVGGVRRQIADAANQVSNGAAQAANAGLNAGVSGLLSSAAQLFGGNASGAADTLANLTGNVAGSALNALNLGGGSNSFTSSNNGIQPGNSLSGAQARLDPMLSYCWYAELPVLTPVQASTQSGGVMTTALGSAVSNAVGGGIIGGLASSLTGSLTNSVTGQIASAISGSGPSATQCPWYYVEEATCPFRVFTTKSVFREGRQKHYPGDYSVGDLTLGMYMDNSNISLAYLKTWENLILSPLTRNTAATQGGQFGMPSNYKKSIFVYLLSVTKQQIMIIEYAECWPVNVQQLTLDSNASNRLIANVQFSVGDVYTTILPVSGSGVSGILDGSLSIRGTAAAVVSSGINTISSAFTGFGSSLIGGL